MRSKRAQAIVDSAIEETIYGAQHDTAIAQANYQGALQEIRFLRENGGMRPEQAQRVADIINRSHMDKIETRRDMMQDMREIHVSIRVPMDPRQRDDVVLKHAAEEIGKKVTEEIIREIMMSANQWTPAPVMHTAAPKPWSDPNSNPMRASLKPEVTQGNPFKGASNPFFGGSIQDEAQRFKEAEERRRIMLEETLEADERLRGNISAAELGRAFEDTGTAISEGVDKMVANATEAIREFAAKIAPADPPKPKNRGPVKPLRAPKKVRSNVKF